MNEVETTFTHTECMSLMEILKITESDFNTIVEIPNFIGYGEEIVSTSVDDTGKRVWNYSKIIPKISLAAQKTGYYSTFENTDVCITEIEVHTILNDIESSLEYYKKHTE